MLFLRVCYVFVIFSINWNSSNCGFVNEPCNERNTLYITSYFPKLSNKEQCLDVTEINPALAERRNFLEVYDIKYTKLIKTIYADGIGFKSIPKVEKYCNLEEYHLPENKISFIPPKAFRRNHKLRLLILNKNKIRTRRNKPLFKSASINILILSMNNIRHIDKYTFVNLPNMHSLYLDNNRISHLPFDSFRSQPKLKYLRVTRNPLAILAVYLPPNVLLLSDIPNNADEDRII